MGIRKVKDKYLLDFYPWGRAGKRIQKKFAKKSEAQAYQKYILAQAQSETKPYLPKAKDPRRLSELIDKWYEVAGKFKRTGGNYYKNLKRTCEKLGDPIGAAIDKKLITNWQIELKNNGRKSSGINREHLCLSNVFTELIKAGDWLHENPMKGISRLKETRREAQFLTIDEIRVLRELVSEKTELLNLIDLLLSTGARHGEAIALTSQNIINNTVRFTETKTGKPRTVPISPELRERIYKPSGNIFPQGRKLRGQLVRLGHKVDLPFESGHLFHCLRHTFASHFIMNGGNILTLKEILGHEDIKMTMIYAHLAPDFLQDAVRFNPISKM